jgi:hypothetical protein
MPPPLARTPKLEMMLGRDAALQGYSLLNFLHTTTRIFADTKLRIPFVPSCSSASFASFAI